MTKKESPLLKKEEFRKYFFISAVIILAAISFFIVRPYAIPLISAFVLAYLCKPVYNLLSKKIPKSLSASICLALVVLLVILPFSLAIGGLVPQVQMLIQGETFENILETIAESQVAQVFDLDFEKFKETGTSTLIWIFKSAVEFLPGLLLAFIVTLFAMYYILVKGDALSLNLKKYIPFRNKEQAVEELSKSTNAIIYGTVFVAFLQFIVAIIGFYLSGVKLFFLLPALIFFLAFIPGIGSTFVWIPTLIYYLVVQNYPTAIGVLITGIILSTFIDTIFRNKYLGEKSRINPAIMLIGVLGGIPLFGVFGFIIGPLILVYTLKIIEEALS